jgi:hypothetical protein
LQVRIESLKEHLENIRTKDPHNNLPEKDEDHKKLKIEKHKPTKTNSQGASNLNIREQRNSIIPEKKKSSYSEDQQELTESFHRVLNELRGYHVIIALFLVVIFYGY